MEITLIVIVFFLILLGCVCVFLPGLPGPVVAWCGPLVYFIFAKSMVGVETLPFITTEMLIVSGIFAVFALAFDFVSSWWGAAKYGASWRGGLGALIGAIVGPVLFSPLGGVPGILIGLLLGPIAGAVAGELLGGSNWKKSTRAGWGTLLGALAAMVVKLFYCLSIFAWFLLAVLFR